MANNFRVTGNSYVSKDGNDANDGLTADTPKATLAPNTSPTVVGCGYYKGAFNLQSGTRSYISDGRIKIVYTDNMPFSTGANNTFDGTSGGIEFDLQGFNMTGIATYINCIVKNANFAYTVSTRVLMDSCVLQECTGNASASGGTDFEKCLIFNTDILLEFTDATRRKIKSTYVDSASTLTSILYFTTPATDFINNNFQGKLSIGGTLYELKKDKNGVDIPARIGNSIADLIDIDATVYDRGNFSQDPEFINLDKGDYKSVSATSPMLFGASNGTNIGNTRFANLIKVGTDTATITDILTSFGDYIYDTGAVADFGTATFDAKQVAPIAQQIGRVDLGELLNFNSDEVIGSAENTNVVISDNYITGTIGANPRRLTYEMRWTDAENMPVVDTDWNNQNYVSAGDFSKFEHFTVPLIDILGRGNGDQRFITAGAVPIKAKWVQVRITIFEGIG